MASRGRMALHGEMWYEGARLITVVLEGDEVGWAYMESGDKG